MFDLQNCLDIYDMYHTLMREYKNPLTSKARRKELDHKLSNIRTLYSKQYAYAEKHILESY